MRISRRFKQFGLRGAFAITAIAALGAWYVGSLVREQSRVQSLRQRLEAAGAKCKVSPRQHWLVEWFPGDLQMVITDFSISTFEAIQTSGEWRCLPNLTSVSIRGLAIPDAVIGSLAECQQLRSLSLTGCKVSESGARQLARLTAVLDELQVEADNLAATILSSLPPRPRVKYLELIDEMLEDSDLCGIEQLESLETLDIFGSRVTDHGLDIITALPRLKGVWANLTGVTENGVQAALARKPDLKINYTPRAEATANLQDVVKMAVADNDLIVSPHSLYKNISDEALRALDCDWSGDMLDFSKTFIDGTGLPFVRHKSQITDIRLRRTETNDAGLACMASFTNLNVLDLEATRITDSETAGKAIGRLNRLCELSLKNTNIGDDFVIGLATSRSINSLNLSRTKVTDAVVLHLKRLPRLTTLDVEKTALSETARNELRRLLASNIQKSGDVENSNGACVGGYWKTLEYSSLSPLFDAE